MEEWKGKYGKKKREIGTMKVPPYHFQMFSPPILLSYQLLKNLQALTLDNVITTGL